MIHHNELVLRDPDAGELALPDDLVTVARSFMAEARSDQTRQAYGRAWRLFEIWCVEKGQETVAGLAGNSRSVAECHGHRRRRPQAAGAVLASTRPSPPSSWPTTPPATASIASTR